MFCNDNIGKGSVIYQQWQAGMQLEKGTTIDLEVSRGPEPAPEPAPSEKPDNSDEKSEQQEDTAENGG